MVRCSQKSHLPQESQYCAINKIIWHSNIFHQHPIHIPLHCFPPGTRKVGSKNSVNISDISSSDRAALNHVVANYGLEIYLIRMANHSLGFVSEFVSSNLFLGEYFKVSANILHKCHILRLLRIHLWKAHLILV